MNAASRQGIIWLSRARCGNNGTLVQRKYSSGTESPRLQRSYLYVPSSSSRMLQKSLSSDSDMLIYDLEDSVAPSQKKIARTELFKFLKGVISSPELGTGFDRNRISIRVNSIDTPFFNEDLSIVLDLRIPTIVLPKVHATSDLDVVSKAIKSYTEKWEEPIKLVASIESARALLCVEDLASWNACEGVATVSALLFAAEDFCADSSIIRTRGRQELLYPRSRIALAAKACQLSAIDMVCINYKDQEYLQEECEDGRRLGYNGKAIHPDQVKIIQSTFVPTAKEIQRAATILDQMKVSYSSSKGAFGLNLADGSKEMIDAPMLKQAENVIRLAKAAGLEVPKI